MVLDFSDVDVSSEKDLVAYAHQKNKEIRLYNSTHPKEKKQKELDIGLLCRMYRKRKRAFIKRYDCENCLEIELLDKCFQKQKCKYAEGEDDKSDKKPRCPRDETGDCPYGNDVGTCFVICYREILREFSERRKNQNGKEQEV